MPPLRSCSVAAPHTRAATEPARPVSLGAAEPSLGSVSGSCGHRRGQFGRVLSAQMATERPQRVPAGMGWTCRSRRRRKSACVQRSAGVSPPGFLGAHQELPELSSGTRRRCAAVARESQAEPSAVALRPGMAWCPRTRSLPFPRALSRLPSWPLLPAACAQRKAQLFGFRVGARVEKVVGVAVSAGMTRGKRTGDKQGGVKAPWHMGCARAVGPGCRPFRGSGGDSARPAQIGLVSWRRRVFRYRGVLAGFARWRSPTSPHSCGSIARAAWTSAPLLRAKRSSQSGPLRACRGQIDGISGGATSSPAVGATMLGISARRGGRVPRESSTEQHSTGVCAPRSRLIFVTHEWSSPS